MRKGRHQDMQQLSIKGTLMFQNTPCCEFVIEDDICTEFVVLCENKNLLPYGCNTDSFQNYKKNLVLFFYDRTTPPTRQFIQQSLAAAGMKYYDMSKIIMYQHGLAQDPYWIRSDEGPQTWEDAKKDMQDKYFESLGRT